MNTGYRTIVTRKTVANRRIWRPLQQRQAKNQPLEPLLDDPMEMGTELVDLATGKLSRPGKVRGR